MFCSAILCLLQDNDTYELVKIAGKDTARSELLQLIDNTNAKGTIERRLMSVEDWETMAQVHEMRLPEDNPLLNYKS